MINDFLSSRIEALQNLIIQYETAISTLLTSNVQSYTLDTGQTRQTVTKFDLAVLQQKLDGMYNQLVILNARINGGNVGIAVPAW